LYRVGVFAGLERRWDGPDIRSLVVDSLRNCQNWARILGSAQEDEIDFLGLGFVVASLARGPAEGEVGSTSEELAVRWGRDDIAGGRTRRIRLLLGEDGREGSQAEADGQKF
jgi:hypothetical protein